MESDNKKIECEKNLQKFQKKKFFFFNRILLAFLGFLWVQELTQTLSIKNTCLLNLNYLLRIQKGIPI